MISYWQQSAWFDRTDVAIIGGGIVGLSAAIHTKLKEPALRVSLFEKGPIPAGATTRNAGFACFGSVGELAEDLQNRPAHEVWTLARQRIEGLNLLRRMVGDEAIRYEACGNYELFSTKTSYEEAVAHMAAMNRELETHTGLKDTFSVPGVTPDDFGFRYVSGLIFNRHEGMLHSGRLAQALMQKARDLGVQLFYGFDVQEIHSEENGAYLQFNTPEFGLECRAVLACTNGFSKSFFPELDLRPARGLVMVTEPIPGLKFKSAFHHNRGYDYFREIDGRILIGGGRNLDIEGETTTDDAVNIKIFDYLENLLQEKILTGRPLPRIEYTWTGVMCVGTAKNPIIQQYAPHVFCAVRMGGMGVALGSQTGADAAEMTLRSF